MSVDLIRMLSLSVELVGKTEQFPGIPWNATVFAIVGFVAILLLNREMISSICRNMIAIPFALGEATNGLVAYIFPQWIHFQVKAILATLTLTTLSSLELPSCVAYPC